MPTDADGALRVELLGPPRAWRGRDELTLGPARQRAVFAVLALRANTVVSRHELIDAVWGESAPASAEGSVYTYISGLRRSLGSQRSRLTSGPAGYSLRLAADDLDIDVFDRLRERGQRADHQGAVELLDAALALWRGEALSGVPGPFAESHRERLAQLRLATVERRAAAVLATGGHVELAAELAGLVREHPMREPLRESLMIALYRSGRHAEALEVFRNSRRVLVEELGIEPGPTLRRIHEQILAGDPALDLPSAKLSVVPTRVAQALRAGPGLFVGREGEANRLRELVSDVLSGRGRAVWIEGEPGIGKSELLTATLADAGRRGCQLAWAVADELGQRFPLQVMQECLGIDAKSPDPRRARLAAELNGDQPARRTWSESDPMLAAVDRLLALVDELCADSPLVLVIDDLQWADEASVLLWHRLCAATRQLPLLLVAASRPAPDRVELAQLRRGVETRDGQVFLLDPLPDTDAERLVEEIVGAPAGPVLRELAVRAAGNPLYLREMVDAVIRAGLVETVAGVADLSESATYDAPRSLVAAIGRRLDFLSADTRDVLRHAALLGVEFAVGDVAATTGRQASDLLPAFEEAVSANVVIDADTQLAFRHPLLRQALYDGMPGAMRAALHRQAAEALAGIGAPVKRVAEQLVAPAAIDAWVVEWLAANNVAVSNRAPLIAVDLLERAIEASPLGDPNREVLLWALVKVLFRLERNPEAQARQALATMTDPYRSAEMRQLLSAILHRLGRTEAAILTIGDAADDPRVPEIWRVRHKHLLADFRRGDLKDLDAAEAAAHQAHELAAGEPYSVAHALQTLWLVNSIRRHHEKALENIDEAISVVGDGADLADLRLDLLDNRMFTLQNLDRLRDAEKTLRAAREVTARHSLPSSFQVSAAVHHYWDGGWDEALAELDTVTEDGPAITFYGLREPGAAALLLHGVAALIAARRDDRIEAAAHLEAAEEYAPATGSERESFDFLLAAQALAAEQRGEAENALSLFAPILNPTYAAMMLRHQWLPGFTRLALEIGDLDRAREALAVCEEEAAKEVPPARAFAAADRCRGLISGDAEPVLAAARHYRAVGRRLELAEALEDAAVLLAQAGRAADAGAAFDEATGIFTELAARWDIRRAESRLRPFGVTRVPAPRPGAGWDALSPIEVRIATLVAASRSNPDIARELALPRRTVQAHVARVLSKLDARSRVSVAEVVRRHAS